MLIEQYLKASGLPYTALYNSTYYENLGNKAFGTLKKLDDGTYSVELPFPEDAYIPSYSVDQSGGWVLEVFKKPEQYTGKTIFAVGEHLTPNQYAAALSKVFGKEVKAKPMTVDNFHMMAHVPNPFVVELYLNMKYYLDHCQPPKSAYGSEAESKKIYPGQYTFEEFARNNEAFRTAFESL
ncbi:NAD(P)-binding protein [Exidia glandulosa HHB12029]|uniref:NAD(P)-binding protein n=1 Tax=Exidia glandulosa HHB12029 TaxID=1314781 RepID=A0A165ED55_EXIGL|nr:NAD(P)-binding protein [Exidia glandulosa HHB12029]